MALAAGRSGVRRVGAGAAGRVLPAVFRSVLVACAWSAVVGIRARSSCNGCGGWCSRCVRAIAYPREGGGGVVVGVVVGNYAVGVVVSGVGVRVAVVGLVGGGKCSTGAARGAAAGASAGWRSGRQAGNGPSGRWMPHPSVSARAAVGAMRRRFGPLGESVSCQGRQRSRAGSPQRVVAPDVRAVGNRSRPRRRLAERLVGPWPGRTAPATFAAASSRACRDGTSSGGGVVRIVARRAATSTRITLETLSRPVLNPRCSGGTQVGNVSRRDNLTAVAMAFAGVSLRANGRVSAAGLSRRPLDTESVGWVPLGKNTDTDVSSEAERRGVEAASIMMHANKVCARCPAFFQAL